MADARSKTPVPTNEPILGYAPGSKESLLIGKVLEEMESRKEIIPLIIGGKEVETGNLVDIRAPHDQNLILGQYHQAGEKEIQMAIDAAMSAQDEWASMPWEGRASVFLKAADLLAGPYRMILNAATMLSQGKTVHQAEIDSACELIDFWRWNPYFYSQIIAEQPSSAPGMWNRLDYRPLEGFVFSITPFNFTSIAGNLPTAPALCGNVGLWKPASSAVLSAWLLMKILMEAGIPPGVINFIPGQGSVVGPMVMKDPNMAGIHFTGSSPIFQNIWKTIGNNIQNYKSYPRIVGETGGKDFMVVHNSWTDIPALVTATIRAAFEYQGQKCSACSRMYVPESMKKDFLNLLTTEVKKIKMGDPTDFDNFMTAVIDEAAHKSIIKYIKWADNDKDSEIIIGNDYAEYQGLFIPPTVIVTTNPKSRTMEEEIFGPVLTIYFYSDDKFEETLEIVNKTSPYALTGAIWAKDRNALITMEKALKNAAGNLYLNDKCTAAVVGQQPFGGARASGTNDKAGSLLNLLRWTSPQTIKETFCPPKNWTYPHMGK